MKPTLASVVVALGIGAAPAAAQTLGLAEALGRADRSAYPNRMAAGEARARGGQATAALAAFLPTVRVENLWSRTTDPLGAFGFTLRQRAVSAASFAPDRLNSPDPISDFGSDLVLEQPLFNPDGLFGRRAAVRARAAGDASRDWTRITTRTEVVRAYFGAVLAAAQVAALDGARRAAEAHVRQAESLVRNGMATRSDALLASVRAGEISARLLSARAETSVAARRLAVAMGTPGDTALLLPPELPPADRIRGVLAGAAGETPPGEPRADVRSARLALEAADADVQRAGAAMLPRLNSFGRLHWSSGSTPYGGQNAWTVGVALSWTPFGGGAELGARQAAAGRRDAAAAAADAAAARAELETAQAGAQLSSALARLDIAERAVEQGAEAHRIVARKYEGGTGTVVELFDAVAAETDSRLALAQARFDAIAAGAALRQALGLDVGGLEDLER